MTEINQPPDQNAATVAYVETSLAALADAMRQVCAAIDRLTADQLTALLAMVDEALSGQPAWEDAAAHTWLSPEYFTLADEVNEMRGQLARALRRMTP